MKKRLSGPGWVRYPDPGKIAEGRGMKTGSIAVMLLFFAAVPAFAKGKVYTNKDLERYQNRALQSSLRVKSSKISIDFTNANIYQVLQMIADVAKGKDGVTIFVSPELSGTTTIKATNLPWTEILKQIIEKHRLSVLSLGKKTLLIYERGESVRNTPPSATGSP